mmetsp:Transcript_10480/g.14860  ORF Transcript_10480/g.14860 Transcript_10480/m.14860 type:complete len:305 (+) Transcript_10480:190-1104(+)
MILITACLLVSHCLTTSAAFSTRKLLTGNKHFISSTRRYNRMPKEQPNDDFYDIDAARIRLEAMMGDEPTGSNAIMERSESSTRMSADRINQFDSLPPPPPLTTIAKERRRTEMHLLSRLSESDDALSDLWSLWFAERGPEAANELLQAEELAGQGPRSWDKAEELLRKIIEDHGVYWAEPVNRLATLMYMQGRLQESRELCELVLTIKPWHFGALSGIVMVFAGLGDPIAARQWAARRLPPIQPTGTNRRRSEWVERAIEDSHHSLVEAEAQLKNAFGKPDKPQRKVQEPPSSALDFDDDAWQ